MIKIENLEKTFVKKAGKKDFKLDINSLLINDDEIVYFIGPNGSGKTTLLSLIQGQIVADRGSVYVNPNDLKNSNDILTIEPHKRVAYIGYVPQESDEALINEMNIIDHVLVSLISSNNISWFFPRKRSKKLVKQIVSQFSMGLEDRLYESVGNLSGGERQVLSFCLASLHKPQILLLDEFTASLDPKMAIQVLDLAISHIRSQKFSALIVTHRHLEALEYADRIIVLHRGKPYKVMKRDDSDFNELALKNIFDKLYSIGL